MELTKEIKECIDKSVLCWLATSSAENMPNVSPKECFTYFGSDSIIVANIASPQTVWNIQQNRNVCISLIDVVTERGFKIRGRAEIVRRLDAGFEEMKKILSKTKAGSFPFATITKITLEEVKPIISPSQMLYPETT